MTGEHKFLVGAGIVTLVLVFAGVLFFGKQKPQQVQGSSTVDLLTDAKHTIGDSNSKVKIVEFGDFQCPACGMAHPIVKQVLDRNKDNVYFVFRNFPLYSVHPNAAISAKAAEAAGVQGKFWEMHDMLYEKQKEWSDLKDPTDKFKDYAGILGIDVNKFESDLSNQIGVVNEDYSLGQKAGVDSTPTFFINGTKYPGVLSLDNFQKVVDESSQ